MASDELTNRLNKIKKVFDIDKVINTKIDNEYIKDYYRVNKLAYSLLHSPKFTHMGISKGNKFNKKDLLEQSLFIDKYIKKTKAKKVLELACGRGANLHFLVKRNPKTKFIGIDFSSAQTKKLTRKGLENLNFIQRDYHDLNTVDSQSIDIVFIVEALCHSDRKDVVMEQVKRVLRPNGCFIIFDGYAKDSDKLDRIETIITKISAVGVALEKFEDYENFKKLARKYFSIVYEKDFSKQILPTARGIEKIARNVFDNPKLSKFIVKILPTELTYNAIFGYLFKPALEDGIARYMVTVLQKQKE